MKPFTFIGPYIIFSPRVPMVVDIQRAVARHFKLPLSEMTSDHRAREFARPRQIAMYLCRKYTVRSIPEIARRFDRDHTTVIHGIRNVSRLIDRDEEVAGHVAKLSNQFEASA